MAETQIETAEQNNFVQLVAFFLAEIIRSRRTSIRRAAEISELIIRNMSSLVSESAALNWIEEIEHDFEELTNLRQALRFNYDASSIQVYEKEIREFAAALFQQDMAKSASFLKDAAKANNTIQELCIQYPEFCSFLITKTDKAPLLAELQPAA
jgi:hypothetical protein